MLRSTQRGKIKAKKPKTRRSEAHDEVKKRENARTRQHHALDNEAETKLHILRPIKGRDFDNIDKTSQIVDKKSPSKSAALMQLS